MERFRYAMERVALPDVEPVGLGEARSNCSIVDNFHDQTLSELLQEAREYVEEETASSLIATQWRMTFDRFPRCNRFLYIPRWPLLSIQSVEYTDAAGDEVELDLDALSVRKETSGQGRIALRRDWLWPITDLATPDAVRITFTAGYGTDPQLVPGPWKRAIKMLVAWWFDNPGSEVPFSISSMINHASCMPDLEEFDLGE